MVYANRFFFKFDFSVRVLGRHRREGAHGDRDEGRLPAHA